MRPLPNYSNIIQGTVIFCILFAIILNIQISYDNIMHPKVIYGKKTEKYILPSLVVKYFSFGFKNVLADFYWINIIQDFAGWNHKDAFYLQEYTNLVTLDPKFAYPYLFGILTVPSYKNKSVTEIEQFEGIANVGIQNLPYNWEIPFYLGTQFHLRKAPEKALQYVAIAASRPVIPDIVQHVYSRYLKKSLSGSNASEAFIKTIYETTESETTKKILKDGMITSDLAKIIKGVVENYKAKFGIYPSSLDDLINNKMIHVEPALQNQFTVTIDKNTGEVEVKSKGDN